MICSCVRTQAGVLAHRVYLANKLDKRKAVFSNQLRSCIGEMLESEMISEDGDEIEAIFGYRSIEARIVLSPIVIGTTTTLLKIIGRNAAKLYRTGAV